MNINPPNNLIELDKNNLPSAVNPIENNPVINNQQNAPTIQNLNMPNPVYNHIPEINLMKTNMPNNPEIPNTVIQHLNQ